MVRLAKKIKFQVNEPFRPALHVSPGKLLFSDLPPSSAVHLTYGRE